MTTSFIVSALPAERFAHLAGLSDAALAEHGARRIVAGDDGRYPCRITLEDAAPGQRACQLVERIVTADILPDEADPVRGAPERGSVHGPGLLIEPLQWRQQTHRLEQVTRAKSRVAVDPTRHRARFREQLPLSRFGWGDYTLVEVESPYRILERGRSGKFNRVRAMGEWTLHEAPGAFVIANVWDGGSARMMAGLDPSTVVVRQIDNSHSGFFWTRSDEPVIPSRHPAMPPPSFEDWR